MINRSVSECKRNLKLDLNINYILVRYLIDTRLKTNQTMQLELLLSILRLGECFLRNRTISLQKSF